VGEADERFDALLRAHEAQTRHLDAERSRVAEQLEELQTALDRERGRADQADAERATRIGLEEEVERLRAQVERADREKGQIQQRYDDVLQMRVMRWSAPLRSLKRRLLRRP
jgi:chromosome segregation ATPase